MGLQHPMQRCGRVCRTSDQPSLLEMQLKERLCSAVVLKGVPVLTVPGLNLNSALATTPEAQPAALVAPTPETSPAVDLQVHHLDIP